MSKQPVDNVVFPKQENTNNTGSVSTFLYIPKSALQKEFGGLLLYKCFNLLNLVGLIDFDVGY